MQLDTFFEDLKVVELASVLAGPAVGMFFAELGAQVTKVENKATGGDVTRRWKLPSEDKDSKESAYYCSVNYKKEVLFADLKDAEDKQKVLGLIAEADIVISNFRPASARKMGMDYQSLKTLNDSLIFAELTGFGVGDTRPAFDVVLQAEAGFLYMCGEPGGNPVKMPVALIDILAAHQLKEGILLALLQKERTGKGALVRTSLLESAVASLANQATNWLMAGHIPEAMGTRHPNIAPYGDMFICKDGKPLILAVGTEKQFTGLCKCLNRNDLTENPLFASNAVRVENRNRLKEELVPVLREQTRAYWLELLHAESVPVGSIRNMEEVFAQPKAAAMILEEIRNGLLSRRVKTLAFTLE